MVHEVRRNFKRNAIDYGVISDGYSFTFIRIDNERCVGHYSESMSPLLEVGRTQAAVRIRAVTSRKEGGQPVLKLYRPTVLRT
jgi:hypothetical protein